MTARKSYRQQFMLTLGQEEVPVLVSAMRRKSMRLQLNSRGEIDLRIPLGTAKEQVLAFVKQHHDWLVQRRSEFRQRRQARSEMLLVQGRQLPVRESALSEFMVSEQAVWVPAGWSVEQTQLALDTWLRSQAKVEFTRMIERWWPAFAHFASQRPQLRIKKMRTRWGSLSQRGYINLNLALMQLPEHLLELVVVHELCHLKHFDHGPGFRALMSQCLPDWRVREQQLSQLARLL